MRIEMKTLSKRSVCSEFYAQKNKQGGNSV